MSTSRKHPDTRLIHAGRALAPHGGITPDITLSTTFSRRDSDHVYSRYSNPVRDQLEAALGDLHDGHATVFASGMAAINSILQSLRPGDHVIVSADTYHGTTRLIDEHFRPLDIAVDYLDTRDLDQVAGKKRDNTRLLWLETPSNPELKITDLAACADWARRHGIVSVCDSTLAPPPIQQALDFGIDLVVHSATKYLGGHSDLLGGLVATRDRNWHEAMRKWQSNAGAVLAPFDCWLLLRSLPTLATRLERQCRNAQAIAEWLAKHDAIEHVYYPGLPTDAGHATAQRQMSAFGALLSFRLRGSEQHAIALAHATRLFTEATSLGSIESLIEHRASVEGAQRRSPGNLIRLSIGLEHAQDLIDDLEHAINLARNPS